MYAVIKSYGKQYKIEENQSLLIDKFEGDPGKKVELTEVLLVQNDGELITGDGLKNVKIKAKVVEQITGKKVLVQKYKKRKRYRKITGHRQQYTKVLIESIDFEGKKAVSEKTKVESKKVESTKSKVESKKVESSKDKTVAKEVKEVKAKIAKPKAETKKAVVAKKPAAKTQAKEKTDKKD